MIFQRFGDRSQGMRLSVIIPQKVNIEELMEKVFLSKAFGSYTHW